MRSFRNSWGSCWHLPIILITAFFLRLGYLEWAGAYALGSQVNDSMEAYEVAVNYLANDERARYIGQPNCNPHSKLPGPAWTLFCVAGLKLGGGMRGIVLATILVNILALALTWYLTRKLFDPASATCAALWMAVSPWTVFYSSIIFNPSLMPLFGVLIFLALFRCLAREKSRAVFFLPFLVLLGLQVHLSLLTLIPPLVALAWLRQMRPAWGWLCAGAIAGLLCYLPYIAGEVRHHWANTHGMLTGGAGGYSATALRVLSSPFSFLINYWAPSSTYLPEEYRALAQQTFGGTAGLLLVNAISIVCCAFIAITTGGLAWRALRGARVPIRAAFARSPGILSAAFLMLAYLFMNLMSGKAFHARYCLIVLPLLFALAGVATASLIENRRYRKIFLPALVITMASSLWFVPRLCWFERQRIEAGPRFIPGIQKLTAMYLQLQHNAGDGTEMEIDDEEYLASLWQEDPRYVSGVIRRYFRAYTLELRAAGKQFTAKKIYHLRAASEVNPADPAVAFYGNGIALVRADGTSQ